MKHGSDSRFDEIKKKPLVFSFAWCVPHVLASDYTYHSHRMAQATWISIVALPAILINSIPKGAHPALGVRDLIAVGIWAGGLGFEIIADRQKSAWRKDKDEKKHEEKFISSGLWALSRHPKWVFLFLRLIFERCSANEDEDKKE